ncbi:AAA domain (dynein-related subfamily) [Planctomycetes bacterium Pla163]|uniref:AAA domain (Dynein-related subfamily) n=1 Tax=Rohdeia mirabilis TaxID=2528008 RepID=A0A518CWH4_9BACT|nr:AAA domain (dynein-related subfamily) [Planctomycetes bacterium Pla163]
MSTQLRQPAEVLFAAELKALVATDDRPRPAGWALSPQAVCDYLMGGSLADGTEISPKYIGNRRLIETAVATLVTDRALLLLGVPGTAKSWLSEHLAAAIAGDSTRLVQCTAGTDEQQLRYSWNYAVLLAKGPSKDALVPTPLMRGMQDGSIVRLEELTRMGSDVQDTLITILSEKLLPIPELEMAVHAVRGFNVIATANTRDKGVNELSSALKRRFNVVVLPLPATIEEEAAIVTKRVGEIGTALQLPEVPRAEAEIARLVTIFRELREGATADGATKLKSPSGNLSTAEAISVMLGAWSEAGYFGSGAIDAHTLSANMVGAIVKDPMADRVVLDEYLETVVRKRKDWADLYAAVREVM